MSENGGDDRKSDDEKEDVSVSLPLIEIVTKEQPEKLSNGTNGVLSTDSANIAKADSGNLRNRGSTSTAMASDSRRTDGSQNPSGVVMTTGVQRQGRLKSSVFSEDVPESSCETIGIKMSTFNCESDSDDEEEVTLMYAQHERVPMKDFHSEVRATLDIEQFLSQPVLLLDVGENILEEVIDKLLNKTLTFLDEPQSITSEAKSSLFTHDSVHSLSKTIQGVSTGQGFDYDQSWICALCTCPSLRRRHVAIARLKHPANFGRTSQEVYFVILVVAPTREKGTKNALETGRTFATIFADMDFRHALMEARTEEEFHKILTDHTKVLAEEQSHPRKRLLSGDHIGFDEETEMVDGCRFAGGLRDDFWRRLPHYVNDFKDGIFGHKTPQKLISTTLFLYFACILPAIAFGVLNSKNTHGAIDVKKVILSQSFGGLFFAMVGGQPLIILLTTAPLALYIKIIYSVAVDFDLDFYSVYACVGLWNSFFLVIYSFTGASRLMKWSTRSTEEIFALFIAIAFCVDALKELGNSFNKYYATPACDCTTLSCLTNLTAENNSTTTSDELCHRENSLLYMILQFGTVWLGLTLFNFTKSPFLDANKREMLADYALPVAVITMSFVGSYLFSAIEMASFKYNTDNMLVLAPVQSLTPAAIAGCAVLGFPLSLLFFMDQNISSALVNSPLNKLKKGPAYHLDLFVVALLNLVLSIFGLPWVHAALPHSPLHVRALADVEERVDQGHVQTIIVRVRETRLTAIFSHILIGLSILMVPIPLQYIPQAVLYGLFLYIAFTSVDGNQLFERILLLITEQAAYPPNHYVRRVPQRKMHTFTFVQLFQLATLCAFGFAPLAYLKMVFPILILFLLPVRHKLVPKIIPGKFLEALDRSH